MPGEITNKLRGQRAKAFGNLFEQIFENTCRRSRIAITRVPDGCKSLGASKLIRVKTPFDWICTLKGRTALIDTKTCLGDSFAHSQISEHQVKELMQHRRDGAIAGYVIWLRKPDSISFILAEHLQECLQSTGSIKEEHGLYLGKMNDFQPTFMFNI